MYDPLTIVTLIVIVLAIYALHRFGEVRQELSLLRRRVDRLEGLEQRDTVDDQPWDLGASRASHHPASGRPAQGPPAAPQPAARPPEPAAPPVVANPIEARPAVYSMSPPRPPEAVSAPIPKQRDLESLLGTGWLTRLGVIAIVLAVAFLLQYAFARIGPATKVGIGLAIGMGFYGSGQLLIRKPIYRSYGQIVSAGGIIAFFVSIYAAHSLFHLIGYWEAFAALVLPALLATVLAVVADTESLAVFCVLGAFSAPVILQSAQGAPDPAGLNRLYAYIVFLNVWAAGMFRFKTWYSVPMSALAATWVLFFTAGPLDQAGWFVEAFAALFLLISVALGLQSIYRWDQGEEARGAAREDTSNPGLWIILTSLVAFSVASGQILSKAGMFGWPALTSIGLLVALMVAILSMAVRGLPATGQTVRQTLAYSAGGAVAAVVGISSLSAPPIPAPQAMTAFGFSVFLFVLFLGVARAMSQRKDGLGPAAVVLASASLVHVQMAQHALSALSLLGVPAAVAWLPIAGCLVLLSLAGSRSDEAANPYTAAIAIAAQGMTLAALAFIPQSDWTSRPHWNSWATGLFAAEFLLASSLWLAMRSRLRQAPFRADLLGAFGSSAIFFALFWSTSDMVASGGIVVIAALAAAMATYHATVGLSLRRSDDALLRYSYLGLATTFLTIAVPLQFKEREITTLAWAAEALALLWTGIAVRDAKSRAYALIVLTLASVKALLFDLARSSEAFRFLLNGRMMAGAATIADCYVAAYWLWRYRSEVTEEEKSAVAPLVTVANILTLLFVSVDLWQFADRTWPSAEHGAAQLALSLFWTIYALAAISVGMWRRVKPVRLFAMGLLYLSISKVFLYDLSGLQQPYRIISFFTLGVILLLISLLYTKFEEWLKDTEDRPRGIGEPPHPVAT